RAVWRKPGRNPGRRAAGAVDLGCIPEGNSKTGVTKMKVMLIGRNGALLRQTEEELGRRGSVTGDSAPDWGICLDPDRVNEALAVRGMRRLVLRSHAYAYGSNAKNPGMMTEERVSLLPPNAPEQRWLRAEEAAAGFPNTAVVRLTNVLAPEEGDLIV